MILQNNAEILILSNNSLLSSHILLMDSLRKRERIMTILLHIKEEIREKTMIVECRNSNADRNNLANQEMTAEMLFLQSQYTVFPQHQSKICYHK